MTGWPRSPGGPSRHDGVTMTCPACGGAFPPSGRRRFCSDACRSAAFRRRRGGHPPAIVVPAPASRTSITVYECDGCGERAVGVQRCPGCTRFMRRVGIGGACPGCDEAITVAELVGLDAGP
jgi:hypothetical protein